MADIGVGSSLTIEETAPSGPGWKPRRVVLLGAGLPFMGAEWGSENNLVTTWYDGNEEGSQQNLGPREMPSTWEGEWNRTRMSRAPSLYVDESGEESRIVSPFALRTVLEDIFRSGQRLRVTWAVRGTIIAGPGRLRGDGQDFEGETRDVDVQIVREGRNKSFRTPIDRATDMRWSMEFHWVGRGRRQDKIAAARDDQDAGKAAEALQASLETIVDVIDARFRSVDRTARKSASVLTLGKLEALAGTPARLVDGFSKSVRRQVNNLKRVGDIALKLRSQPFAIAGSVLDLAANTMAVANKFTDELSRQPPEQRALRSKVSTVLRSTNYFNRVALGASDAAAASFELDARFRRSLVAGANAGALTGRDQRQIRRGDILAVHICKDGETPSTVALRYYGSADHAVDLLRGNRLPWYTPTFNRGQILVIFALSGALAQSRA